MKFATIAIAALLACTAQAQQLKVATGTKAGTYSQELREMQQFCGQDVAMVPVETTGAVENLELLTNNKVNMAFVQSDLLYRRARTQDLGNVKTLLALHREQIHFIARRDTKVEVDSGSWFKPNEKRQLLYVEQLAGLSVAAGGGALETARQIKTDSDVGYAVVEAKDSDDALARLIAKQVAAALLVGGQPLGNLGKLGPEYTVLTFTPATLEKIKGAYKPDRVSYSKMNVQGVQTVSIDALLVTREYTTERMTTALGKFRQCVLSKVGEIKETTDTHPAWQTVDPTNRGRWNWYTLPGGK